MSLIFTIKSRKFEDLLNDGAKVIITGAIGGNVTDQVVLACGDRALTITGMALSLDVATPALVSLGFKKGGDPTLVVFNGYVGANGPVVVQLPLGSWYYGDLGYNVVITTSANTGNLAFSIDMRTGGSPVPLGYIEQIGVKAHQSPRFPDPNAVNRGVSEI
jgi:hypothetical protein